MSGWSRVFNGQIIGSCGNCGGPVVAPTTWLGGNPPTPSCADCGATVKPDYGHRLPMNPPPVPVPESTKPGEAAKRQKGAK